MQTDTYRQTPKGDFTSRQKAFLEFSAASEASGGGAKLFSQISRLEINKPVDEESIRSGIQCVNERHACADFTASGLLRILYKFLNIPYLLRELSQEIKASILNSK